MEARPSTRQLPVPRAEAKRYSPRAGMSAKTAGTLRLDEISSATSPAAPDAHATASTRPGSSGTGATLKEKTVQAARRSLSMTCQVA